jgi:phage tail-like protein
VSDYPIHLFRFHVEFRREKDDDVKVAKGAFSECTGLEATMEAKVIKAGGANYGAYQRAGRVTFATVILKRGITNSRDLWKWFSHVNEQGKFAYRLDVKILVFDEVLDLSRTPFTTIELFRALPVKFKFGDLNARATDVGIEELHLAHEGLAIR